METTNIHTGSVCLVVPSPRDGNTSEEMDTDLDIEVDDKLHRIREERISLTRMSLNIGEQCYLDACALFDILPIKLATRQLQGPSLQLKHVGLSVNDAQALACALKHNSRVESLDLEDNGLRGDALNYIVAIFLHNIFITNLSLSDNRIGVEEALAISTMLQETKWLTRLNLSVLPERVRYSRSSVVTQDFVGLPGSGWILGTSG
ncbi:hypothetical protein ScPMuIL_014708 [Solemya velum]